MSDENDLSNDDGLNRESEIFDAQVVESHEPGPLGVAENLAQSPFSPSDAVYHAPPVSNRKVLIGLGIGCGVLALFLFVGIFLAIWMANQLGQSLAKSSTSRSSTSSPWGAKGKNPPVFLVGNDDVARYENRDERYAACRQAFNSPKLPDDLLPGSPAEQTRELIKQLSAAFRGESRSPVTLLLDKKRFLVRAQNALMARNNNHAYNGNVALHVPSFFDDEIWFYTMHLHQIEEIADKPGHYRLYVFGQNEDGSVAVEAIVWCVKDTNSLLWRVYDWERLDLGYVESELTAISAADDSAAVSELIFNNITSAASSMGSGDRQAAAASLLMNESMNRGFNKTQAWLSYSLTLQGYFWNQIDCPEKAIQQFRVSRQADLIPGTYFGEAAAYLRLGDYPAALIAINHYIDLLGVSPSSLGLKLEILKELGESEQLTETLLQLHALETQSNYQLAEVFNHFLDDPQKIRDFLDTTLQDLDGSRRLFEWTSFNSLSYYQLQTFQKFLRETPRFTAEPGFGLLDAEMTIQLHQMAGEFDSAAEVYRTWLKSNDLTKEDRGRLVVGLLNLSPYFADMEVLRGDVIGDAEMLSYYESHLEYAYEGNFSDLDQKWLNDYYRDHPDDVRAMSLQASILVQKSQHAEAVELLKRALEGLKKDPSVVENADEKQTVLRQVLANEFLSLNRITDALDNNQEPWFIDKVLAVALNIKDLNQLQDLDRLASKNANFQRGHKQMIKGMLAAAAGDENAAFQAFKRALTDDETNLTWVLKDQLVNRVIMDPTPEKMRQLQPMAEFYPTLSRALLMRGDYQVWSQLNEIGAIHEELKGQIEYLRAEQKFAQDNYNAVNVNMSGIGKYRFVSETYDLELLKARACVRAVEDSKTHSWKNVDVQNGYLASPFPVLHAVSLRPEAIKERMEECLRRDGDLTALMVFPEIRKVLKEEDLSELRTEFFWDLSGSRYESEMTLWFQDLPKLDEEILLSILKGSGLERYSQIKKLELSPQRTLWLATDSQGFALSIATGTDRLNTLDHGDADGTFAAVSDAAKGWLHVGFGGLPQADPLFLRRQEAFALSCAFLDHSPTALYWDSPNKLHVFQPGTTWGKQEMLDFRNSLEVATTYLWLVAEETDLGEKTVATNHELDPVAASQRARSQVLQEFSLAQELVQMSESLKQGKKRKVELKLSSGLLSEVVSVELEEVIQKSGGPRFKGRLLGPVYSLPFLREGDQVLVSHWQIDKCVE